MLGYGIVNEFPALIGELKLREDDSDTIEIF